MTCRQQARQKVTRKLLRLQSIHCLIRHSRELSRHSRACRRACKRPLKDPKAVLGWLRLERGTPPCPAQASRGVKPSVSLPITQSQTPTGEPSHLVKFNAPSHVMRIAHVHMVRQNVFVDARHALLCCLSCSCLWNKPCSTARRSRVVPWSTAELHTDQESKYRRHR